MVSDRDSSEVDMCSSFDRIKPRTIKLVFFAFSAKHASQRTKSKDWSARNQDNVFD